MKARCRYSALVTMLALVFLLLLPGMATAATADNAMSSKAAAGNIADRWVLWPKPGQTKAFESAIKQYAAWRKQAGDPFALAIFQPIVGNDLTYYSVRSDDHAWKDVDGEDAWEAKTKAEDAFEQQVGPYVAKVEHFFERDDTAHSQWIDKKDYRNYKYFGVTSRRLKAGSRGDMAAALDKIQKAITDEKWPYHYRLAWQIGGDDHLRIIVPMKDYAGMAEPNPSLRQVLAKSLGSDDTADATMKQFGSSFEGDDYTVFVARPDLSTQP